MNPFHFKGLITLIGILALWNQGSISEICKMGAGLFYMEFTFETPPPFLKKFLVHLYHVYVEIKNVLWCILWKGSSFLLPFFAVSVSKTELPSSLSSSFALTLGPSTEEFIVTPVRAREAYNNAPHKEKLHVLFAMGEGLEAFLGINID